MSALASAPATPPAPWSEAAEFSLMVSSLFRSPVLSCSFIFSGVLYCVFSCISRSMFRVPLTDTATLPDPYSFSSTRRTLTLILFSMRLVRAVRSLALPKASSPAALPPTSIIVSASKTATLVKFSPLTDLAIRFLIAAALLSFRLCPASMVTTTDADASVLVLS